MSLTEARDAWRAARLAVDKGESPAHIRPTAADTFAAVADEWLKRDQGQNRSAAEVRRVIARDINPVWGDRLAASITRRDASELIDSVADRGALTMARRIHAHLHRLFRWAVGRGIIEINPMADLPKPGTAVKRDRVLTDRELAAIWNAAATIGWPFGPAVQLLILTATRREEVGSLRWSEIHGDEIRIPGERSKSGEPRTIPLSSAALKLIGTLPRIDGDGYVFTTTGSTAISGWSKAKQFLDAGAAEINGGALAPWRLPGCSASGPGSKQSRASSGILADRAPESSAFTSATSSTWRSAPRSSNGGSRSIALPAARKRRQPAMRPRRPLPSSRCPDSPRPLQSIPSTCGGWRRSSARIRPTAPNP
jgi:integrase